MSENCKSCEKMRIKQLFDQMFCAEEGVLTKFDSFNEENVMLWLEEKLQYE
jgi:hypothetical protein